jgi:uncharacterized phage-associated protein
MMAVRLPFNEAKATEAAAYLLKQNGSPMSYLKLIKLLYLADREALLRFARPITTDRYILTSQGPSLSQVNDLITLDPIVESVWNRYISPLEGKLQIALLQDAAELGELSEAETEVIDTVVANYGQNNQQQLSKVLQALPEWHDPQGTKIPLEYKDILRAGGKTASEIDAVTSELESLAAVINWIEPYRSGTIRT